MSSSSSKPTIAPAAGSVTPGSTTDPSQTGRGWWRSKHTWVMTLVLPAWVFIGFMAAQLIVVLLLTGLQLAGISFNHVDTTLFNTIGNVVIYGLALLIVLGVPWLARRWQPTREKLGLQRLPTWLDMLWAPAGAVVYIILTSLVSAFATAFLPFVNYTQTQQTGFTNLSGGGEYALAFISLVVIAPVAEELLFRGFLFGRLRAYLPLWASVLVTSLLFGLVHFQWNVSLDVFALSIVLCLLRIVSGSLWPSIMLHMLKNGLAFYFLFINPVLASTMGG